MLFGGSILWPLYYVAAFSANKHIDVGIFSVITNLSPVVTLAIALPFLNESLTFLQVFGVAFLIFSGALAASTNLGKGKAANWYGIRLCLLTAFFQGLATVYEKFMLGHVDFGAYLIYGWGAQVIWAIIFAHRDLRDLPTLFSSPPLRAILLIWGIASVLRSTSYILALKLGSASIVSASTDFISITVILAAYFYLREREHMAIKWTAAFIGIAGLLLVAG